MGVCFANENKEDAHGFLDLPQGHPILQDKTMIRTPVVEIPLESLSAEAKVSFCSNFMLPMNYSFLDLSTNKKVLSQKEMLLNYR